MKSFDENVSRSADEKSSVIGVGLGGLGPGGSSTITETKDGKILRIRPLDFAWKYERASLQPLEDGGERKDLRTRSSSPSRRPSASATRSASILPTGSPTR